MEQRGWPHWKLLFGDFPSSPVAKNLPASGGDTSSTPGLGRSYLGAAKPVHHNCGACMSRACALQREACTMTKRSPCSLQLEKAREQQCRPSASIKKKKKKKFLFVWQWKLLHPPTLHWLTQVIRPKPKPVKWAWDFFSGRCGKDGERINNAKKKKKIHSITYYNGSEEFQMGSAGL